MTVFSKSKLLVPVAVFVLLSSLTLVVFLSSVNKSKNISSKAAPDEDINVLKAQLATKPLSSFCAERNSSAITPFDGCSGTRLSNDSNNPLYYCCR